MPKNNIIVKTKTKMTNKKNSKSPEKGNYTGGKWECKNLAFLVEFMGAMGITPPDMAEKIGQSRQVAAYWMRKDNMELSKAKQLLSAYGYELKMEYTKDEQCPVRTTIRLKEGHAAIDPNKKLYFLRQAMVKYNFSMKEIAGKLDISYNSVLNWLNVVDDIPIKHLHSIAEQFGLTLQIKIEPKE